VRRQDHVDRGVQDLAGRAALEVGLELALEPLGGAPIEGIRRFRPLRL
jgi:hypothetical protein